MGSARTAPEGWDGMHTNAEVTGWCERALAALGVHDLRLLAGLACYAMSRTVVVAPSGSRRTLNGNPVVASCVRLGPRGLQRRVPLATPLDNQVGKSAILRPRAGRAMPGSWI